MFVNAKLEPIDCAKCPICENNRCIKYGTTIKRIKEKLFLDYKTLVLLTVQKYKCKECGSVFNDSTDIIQKNKTISTHLKLAIIEELRTPISLTNIGKRYNLSAQEVYNIFVNHVQIERHQMPEVLCIDEFKNLRTEDGKYAVVLYDPMNHKIIDIIDNRRLNNLDDYFIHINFKELDKVKYLITDMYEGYRSVKKRYFKNATHVVDGFHVSRYITDALNKVRIRVMNSYDRKTQEYKILKKYWATFLKRLSDVKSFEAYNPIQKKRTSSSDIIKDALEINKELYDAFMLKEEYFLMEDIIHLENSKNKIKEFTKTLSESTLEEFRVLAGMFDNWYTEICNSYIRFGDKRLNNAYAEGINNKIKSIKKISYGCRSFYYLRNRVMFIVNDKEPIKDVDPATIPRKERK